MQVDRSSNLRTKANINDAKARCKSMNIYSFEVAIVAAMLCPAVISHPPILAIHTAHSVTAIISQTAHFAASLWRGIIQAAGACDSKPLLEVFGTSQP